MVGIDRQVEDVDGPLPFGGGARRGLRVSRRRISEPV